MTTTASMTHKEMTAHFRKRLAASGIKARCKMVESCGVRVIAISPPGYHIDFTEAEQREMCLIAIANRLTLAQGMSIDPDQGTYTRGVWFEYHG